jgi:hypothetical protein
MPAVARNLSLITPSIFTELPAILVSAWTNAHAPETSALFLIPASSLQRAIVCRDRCTEFGPCSPLDRIYGIGRKFLTGRFLFTATGTIVGVITGKSRGPVGSCRN